MASIQLTPEHGYVLMVAAVVGLQAMAAGASVMAVRKRVFGKAFKEKPAVKAMFEEHKKAFGAQPFCVLGYPDMGSGQFAQQLPYADWLALNNAQRGHQNMLEGLPAFYACLLGCGVQQPKLAAWLGAVYVVGRAAYKSGYVAKGPKGREVGSAVAGLGAFGLLGSCLYQGWQLAQPLKRFQ